MLWAQQVRLVNSEYLVRRCVVRGHKMVGW